MNETPHGRHASKRVFLCLAVDLMAPPDLLILNKSACETILDHVQQPIPAEQLLQVQTAETAINMVPDGIGIGILSEYTMDTLVSEYQKYLVTPEIAFDIWIFANYLDDLTPAATQFVQQIVRNFSPQESRTELLRKSYFTSIVSSRFYEIWKHRLDNRFLNRLEEPVVTKPHRLPGNSGLSPR